MQIPLTVLGFSIISAIDTGKYERITADEVKNLIQSGEILDFLRQLLGNDTYLSILDTDDRELKLLSSWQSMANGIDTDNDLGIKNKGLTLLIAYVLQGLSEYIPIR